MVIKFEKERPSPVKILIHNKDMRRSAEKCFLEVSNKKYGHMNERGFADHCYDGKLFVRPSGRDEYLIERSAYYSAEDIV